MKRLAVLIVLLGATKLNANAINRGCVFSVASPLHMKLTVVVDLAQNKFIVGDKIGPLFKSAIVTAEDTNHATTGLIQMGYMVRLLVLKDGKLRNAKLNFPYAAIDQNKCIYTVGERKSKTMVMVYYPKLPFFTVAIKEDGIIYRSGVAGESAFIITRARLMKKGYKIMTFEAVGDKLVPLDIDKPFPKYEPKPIAKDMI